VRDALLDDERLEQVWDVGVAMGQCCEDDTRRCPRGESDLDMHPGDDETNDEVARRFSTVFPKHAVQVLDEL
jgi:hypothetical protein